MNYELYRTAIFDALCACVNLDRHSREAAALIHEAYAEPENVPRPPRNRNVIYWTLLQDPASDPVSTAYLTEAAGTGRNTTVVYTTLKYQLIIVCYGPASEEYALRIRSLLYLDGVGFPRWTDPGFPGGSCGKPESIRFLIRPSQRFSMRRKDPSGENALTW